MKFYKYECMGCRGTTMETNKQATGIFKPAFPCSKCKSTAFKLIGVR